MGKAFNGAIKLASTIGETGAQPLDDRVVVPTYSDLIDPGTWGTAFYVGMLVEVQEENNLYILKNGKTPSDGEAAWQRISKAGSIDGADITTGTIDIKRLPSGAFEVCYVVETDAKRLALTKSEVQNGDTVKVTKPDKTESNPDQEPVMYLVVNDELLAKDGHLAKKEAFEVYTAGNASTAPWAGITEKPFYFKTITGSKGGSISADNIDDTLKILGNDNWIDTQVDQSKFDGGENWKKEKTKEQTVLITHKTPTFNNPFYSPGKDISGYGATGEVLTGVSKDDKGHIIGAGKISITMPSEQKLYETVSGNTGTTSATTSTDTLAIKGNENEDIITTNVGNNVVSISHKKVKKYKPTDGSKKLVYGGDFTTVNSIECDEYGHITGHTEGTITIPSEQPAYTKLSGGSGTATAETSSEEIVFSGGTKISTSVTNENGKDTVTIAHTGSKATQNTDDPQSPAHNSSFTALKTITCDDLGHVSSYTPTTVTIPAETELSLAGEQNNQFISNVSVGDHTITLASANETSLSISDEAGTSGWYSSFKQSGSSNHTVVLTKTKPGISDVTGLSNELAKYLPLAGGDMDNNSSIRWTDGDAVATINGNCGGGDSYLNLSATDVIKLDCLTTEMTGELSVNTIKPNTGYTINFPSGATMNILSVDGIDSNTGDTVNFPSGLNSDAEIRSSKGFFDDSDERLKNFTDDIDIDFDKIKAIPKKYYYWKDKENRGDKLQLGTSAQELMKIYPELVSEDKEGYLSVNYARLSVIALKAVDVLHEENEQLKERLRRIEEKLGM